ncbi:unnamed protein product [Mytilus edulis]|uniref:Tyr recombinase domain-containing protein n=1 Tax=Mytilus edulis TaxID=6550 RepID=A0A8S3PPV9_MYTED|nr:unnamed protein product [Mytilus edulis]
MNSKLAGIEKNSDNKTHSLHFWLRRPARATKLLEESIQILKKRNKLIQIADKSAGGWNTVQEYLSDDVASNSEDEKRIRATESRAVRKIKTTKTYNVLYHRNYVDSVLGHWTSGPFLCSPLGDSWSLGHIWPLEKSFSSGFWNDSDRVQSSELKRLLFHLRSTVIDSRAKTTVSKYANGFKRFLAWAQKYPEIDSILPASELYAHKLANLVDPCESDLVGSIVESWKRILNRPVQKKELINATIIKTLFNRFCNPRTLRDLRLLSICTVSYAGFLRYSELCSIKTNNLAFKPQYLDFFISSSNTDCYRNGKSVVIAKTNTPFCPVAILLDYIKAGDIVLTSDMYIFRSIVYVKKYNKFVFKKKNAKLSYTRAREIVKAALSFIGLDAKLFGLYSFRSVGASAVANNGFSDRFFKAHGRWKTENAKDGYIADNLDKRLSVSKKLGI